MNQSAINVRYAKAFFSLAKEKNMLDILKTDVVLVNSVCLNSPDFMLFLDSPVVKTSKKIELIESVFNKKIHALTLQFLTLITKNKREIHIPGICRNFIELTKKEQNIRSVKLITAAKISTASVKRITQLLGKELKATVELSTLVDPDILGGLVLRVDDIQYDASVASQLKKINQKLLG